MTSRGWTFSGANDLSRLEAHSFMLRPLISLPALNFQATPSFHQSLWFKSCKPEHGVWKANTGGWLCWIPQDTVLLPMQTGVRNVIPQRPWTLWLLLFKGLEPVSQKVRIWNWSLLTPFSSHWSSSIKNTSNCFLIIELGTGLHRFDPGLGNYDPACHTTWPKKKKIKIK